MQKSQLLAELIGYDFNKGRKRKKNGDAPVVRALKAFLATRTDANDMLIPYADFVSYLQAQGQIALVAEQALAGKSLSKALIRKWADAERAAELYRIPPPAAASPPQDASAPKPNHPLVAVPVPAPAANLSQNTNPMFSQGSTDVWRNAMSRHLDLRSLSHLAQTCRFFRDIYHRHYQEGLNQVIRPLLPRLQDEHSLREKFEALIKISDDLQDSQGRVFWSGKPAMEEAKALVLTCKVANPKLNLFYKQGYLQTRGLPPLYLAASRSNKELWQWLHDQMLEQVPEAERSRASAIAQLQWHATNCELEATQALLAEHPDLVLAKNPLLTWNSTPLYIAASLQYREVYDLLVSQAPPEYAPVSELMWLVITGQQDERGNYEAANYSENNPELMLMSGIDGKSPWQIACAHGDTRLMQALLAKLPADAYKAALLQQEEVDKNNWHCTPEPFFKAYDAFIDGFMVLYQKKEWESLDVAWLRMGDEFRRQPQHRQALYFQAYCLDPVPDFKKVYFQRGCVFGEGDDLFPIRPAVGPGFEFTVSRAHLDGATGWCYRGRIGRWGGGELGWASDDLLAQKALYARNQEEYLEIKQWLHDKVAQSEAAPSPGLG
jgi:hypothetical protein